MNTYMLTCLLVLLLCRVCAFRDDSYMAPERIDGRDYSFSSDVWSLGLTLLSLALGKLPLNTSGGFWSILHSIRDSAPPSLPDDDKWSPEFRDFISQCFRHDPLLRPSCAQLLTHPFVLKAPTSELENPGYSSSGPPDERSEEELRAVITALYQHLCKLRENNEDNSSLLLNACKNMSTIDILSLILFGEDPRSTSNGNVNDVKGSGKDSFDSVAKTRLALLARQLHLPVDRVLTVSRAMVEEITRENLLSVGAFLATPKVRKSSKRFSLAAME